VPTLELEDQTTISESVAICRYFEALQPQPPMFGRTPFEQAEVEMWTRRVEFVLTQPVGNFWRHAHPRTSALLTQYKDFGESNREGWNRAVAWLDRELEGRSFIAGDSFTIADVCALTTVDFAAWIGLPVAPELARLSDWRAKVSARPSAKA
jgi:glutathione S-transferase